MTTNELFIMATRQKFRFPFKGMATVEDLWDMNVRDLDTVFKALNSQLKQTKEESLLTTKSVEDAVLEAKIGIIKHIVSVKQAETAHKAELAEKREKKQRIMEIIAAKQDAALQDKSEEELKKMLEDMDD